MPTAEEYFQPETSEALLAPPICTRAKAPLRLGLAGGGTDLSPYCDMFGGAVLNTTIDRYAFAFLTPRGDGMVQFQSVDIGGSEIYQADKMPAAPGRLLLHHGVHQRISAQFRAGAPLSFDVVTSVDVPAGSGLGASSALVVALVDAYREALDLPLGRYDVARLAYEIERFDLRIAGGRQDHYAAAFGGSNFIEFLPNDRVIVNPLRASSGALDELEASLVTCFTGKSRKSHDIIVQQVASMEHGIAGEGSDSMDALHQLKQDAIEMKGALLHGNIKEMARILTDSWQAKKRTASGITNAHIDLLHDEAIRAGAYAGKVSGAGGGGFMLFLTPPERRRDVVTRLNELGGHADVVAMTDKGASAWQVRH
jgi:D-glycero-alpha-D-manno-heptose-7-phosphate kinase